MKAVVYKKYGLPDVFHLREVEKPAPKGDEVLVKIHATSVNFSDWTFVRGKPYIMRLFTGGVFKPKNQILGADIAGTVEVVGSRVKQFRPGDEVFGDISGYGWGGFAEYVSVPEKLLGFKPANLTLTEAAAVPQAMLVALHGLRVYGQIQPGQKVLINGASGGIGTFALQIARSFGADVTAVCSARNSDLVRSLGAKHVIDYTREDFTRNGQLYDLILDIKASRTVQEIERALGPNGMYVLVGGSLKRIIQVAMARKKNLVNLSVESDQADLALIKEYIEAGKVAPVIDRCYPLSEVADAVSYYGRGHSQGKVVITV